MSPLSINTTPRSSYYDLRNYLHRRSGVPLRLLDADRSGLSGLSKKPQPV